jgi:hypothetical protein
MSALSSASTTRVRSPPGPGACAGGPVLVTAVDRIGSGPVGDPFSGSQRSASARNGSAAADTRPAVAASATCAGGS